MKSRPAVLLFAGFNKCGLRPIQMDVDRISGLFRSLRPSFLDVDRTRGTVEVGCNPLCQVAARGAPPHTRPLCFLLYGTLTCGEGRFCLPPHNRVPQSRFWRGWACGVFASRRFVLYSDSRQTTLIAEGILTVEEAIACGFHQVTDCDIALAFEVGDGPGDFDDTIVSAH